MHCPITSGFFSFHFGRAFANWKFFKGASFFVVVKRLYLCPGKRGYETHGRKRLMIPAEFDYYRPKDMPGVISLLEQHGDTARVLAGGHSLIPLMKVRMADVNHLIDLKDVADMNSIQVTTDNVKI